MFIDIFKLSFHLFFSWTLYSVIFNYLMKTFVNKDSCKYLIVIQKSMLINFTSLSRSLLSSLITFKNEFSPIVHVTTASNWPAYCRASSLLENVKLYKIKGCARLVIGSGHIATWGPLESARYAWNGLLKAINRPHNFVVGHVLTFNLSKDSYAVTKKRTTIAS